MLKAHYVALALLLTGVPAWIPAMAQSITQADRTDIAARIAAFDALMKSGRVAEVASFIPPRIIATTAEQAGITEADLLKGMAAQTVEAFKLIKLVSFGMDVQAATPGKTPDQRRSYLLIPTETLMELPDGRRLRSRSSTLALKDDGNWYLVRIDNAQQILMLREAYPEFTGVDFPSGSTSAAN